MSLLRFILWEACPVQSKKQQQIISDQHIENIYSTFVICSPTLIYDINHE